MDDVRRGRAPEHDGYASDLAQRLAETERALAEQGLQLAAARARELLLERLARIQRQISRGSGLQEALDAITAGAHDVLGTDSVLLTLATESGTSIASCAGARNDLDSLRSTIAADVSEDGRPAGRLIAGSLDVDRRFSRADHEALQSFAESAGRALADAHAVESSLQQALHDPLTGLPNRALFLDRIAHALSNTRKSPARIGVLLIDVDRFRSLNDSLGHGGGDAVLREVAARLRGCLRAGDTAARLGGDQFGLIVTDAWGPDEVSPVAERILAAMRAPVPLGDKNMTLSASIGVVIADSAEDAGEVLRDADMAMRSARTNGRGRFQIFHPSMRERRADRLELEADLQEALDDERAGNERFAVHYQPIVGLDDGRTVAFEALVRWRHDRRGLLHPESFISVAEESSLIVPLGRLVMRRAFADLRAWRERHPGADLSVSINLSPAEFMDDSLVETVMSALGEARIPATALIVEITESAFLRDSDATMEKLWALRAAGIRIAIDDFGTGYSSLGYLRRFPIDVIKIDKSFIDGVAGEDDDATLARGIVKLGHMLRLQIVAEGIESAEQLERLRALRVQFGQGYHLARPLACADVDAYVDAIEKPHVRSAV
jgi:diguanylate cyclase (GGDEF)-like protein